MSLISGRIPYAAESISGYSSASFSMPVKIIQGKKAHNLWKLFLYNTPRAIQFRVQLVFPLTLFWSITLIYHMCFSRAEAQCKINSKLNNLYCNNSAWTACGTDEKHSFHLVVGSALMRHFRWVRWDGYAWTWNVHLSLGFVLRDWPGSRRVSAPSPWDDSVWLYSFQKALQKICHKNKNKLVKAILGEKNALEGWRKKWTFFHTVLITYWCSKR